MGAPSNGFGFDHGGPVVFVEVLQSVEQGVELSLQLTDVSVDISAVPDVSHQCGVVVRRGKGAWSMSRAAKGSKALAFSMSR